MRIRHTKWLLGPVVCVLTAATLTPHAGRTAGEKLQRIIDERLRPSEVLIFTEHEVNSFFAYELPPEIPEGINNVRVQILEDSGLIDADVDLQKVQAAAGSRPSLLLGFLLSGKRHVRASCRFTSADGVGVVEIESIDIDGWVFGGSLLDWIIDHYVVPRVPEFQPGEPMPLPKKLKAVGLEEGRAVVEGI